MSRIFRPGLAKLGLASLAALLCTGCAVSLVTYELDRYGNVVGIPVYLSCRDTYEVFDRPDAASLLVSTNAVNESGAALCGDGTAGLPKEERLRRVARIFLDEKSNRPLCRINRETQLTSLQTEFSYRCPAPPTVVTKKPARL